MKKVDGVQPIRTEKKVLVWPWRIGTASRKKRKKAPQEFFSGK